MHLYIETISIFLTHMCSIISTEMAKKIVEFATEKLKINKSTINIISDSIVQKSLITLLPLLTHKKINE
jgi:hypothetical protein